MLLLHCLFYMVIEERTMQTPLAPVSLTHSKLYPCICKTYILPIDIPIFNFLQQFTLVMLTITKQLPYTHIIGKQGQQSILTITFELFKVFLQR